MPKTFQLKKPELAAALETVGRDEAHYVFLPGAGKAASTCFLEEIVRPGPTAYHIIIQDQAGLHLRAGPDALPPRIHLLPLLSCCPAVLDRFMATGSVRDLSPIGISAQVFGNSRAPKKPDNVRSPTFQ